MISHVFIGANDLTRAAAFYGPIMEVFGCPLKFVDEERGWAVWTSPNGARPFVIVGRPFDGAATPGNGAMTALPFTGFVVGERLLRYTNTLVKLFERLAR